MDMTNTRNAWGNSRTLLKGCLILGLILFLLWGTLQAEPERGHGTKGMPASTEICIDTMVVTPDDSVAALGMLPQTFRDVQPNLISRPECLIPIFKKIENRECVHILQLGDSHVAAKNFPQAVSKVLQKAWGAANDSSTTGIQYDYMAKNGATIAKFLTDERKNAIRDKQPHLIILSFGTNECHGMGYAEATHRQELETALNTLREVCPDATLLMTTPPGDYLATRQVTYRKKGSRRRVVRYASRPNPMSTRCAALLQAIGEEQKIAVWDLQTIAGGHTAVRNYVSDGLMANDRIHFTPEGYQLHGELLGKALILASACHKTSAGHRASE